MTQFDRHFLGEWKPDPLYELWVRAWTAYYQAADRIDGHIIQPRSEEDYKLRKRAVIAGEYAMKEVLDDNFQLMTDIRGKISQRARREALKRVENGKFTQN